jgi:hypothetical protein
VRVGGDRYDVAFERGAGRAVVHVAAAGVARDPHRIVVAPAFPLDARVRRVTVNGTAASPATSAIGDVQRVAVTIDRPAAALEIVFTLDDGTDVHAAPQPIEPGADNHGVRVLRVRPDSRALHLLVEGRGGRAYALDVRTPHRLGVADGVRATAAAGGVQRLEIRFDGPAADYVRREIEIPFVR